MKKVFLVALIGLPFNSLARAAQPNVLMVIADDLMKQVQVYDNDAIKTPHLKAFSADALRFDRAYCQYPLCGPSRASLMLSKYPTNSGITWNQLGKSALVQKKATELSLQTMPAFFKNHGYITVGGGKLYHDSVVPGSDSAQVDFTVAFNNHGRDGKKVKSAGDEKKTNITMASDFGITEHKDGNLVKQAKGWLTQYAKQDKGKPFFMCLGLKKPHSPFAAPKQFFKKYPRKEMKICTIEPPADILEYYSLSEPNALLKVHADTEQYDAYTLPAAKKREMIRGYAACVSYADYLVGDLLATLKKSGLYDNTIIVFTSDHGYKLGEYSRWAKFTLHEKDAVVPLLVRVPEITTGHGKTSEAIVGLIDLFPTLAQQCALPAPKNIDGVDFSTTLHDPAVSERDYVHTFVTRIEKDGHPKALGASIMHRNGYRYTQWSNESAGEFPSVEPVGVELYDHYDQADTPISTTNLRKTRPDLVETMKQSCQRPNVSDRQTVGK